MPKSSMFELSSIQSRPQYMRRATEVIGEALHLDVSVHSVSGKKDGRPVPYPPELLMPVKSRRRAYYAILFYC